MTISRAEKPFAPRITSAANATIYLSTSWRPGKGQNLSYRLVRRFDQHSVLVVGDAKDLRFSDEDRIRRIMSQCNGMLAVMPLRPDEPSTTSPEMVAELRIAASLGLPIALLYEAGIELARAEQEGRVALTFGSGQEPVVISGGLLCSCHAWDPDVPLWKTYREAAVDAFRDRVVDARESAAYIPPYAFLITRLKDDFARARHAIAAAVQLETGLPCIWIDHPGYATDVEDTVERTRLLIQHAQFVIADLSLSEDHPDYDNPTRAHEIGVTTALGKKLFITAQKPRRDPYHALSVKQVIFWSDEAHLFRRVQETLHAERHAVGRHTYNWDPPLPGDAYSPKLAAPEYDGTAGKPHHSPSASALSRAESWTLAVCFAASALAASILVNRYTGFGDTFDFSGVVGAVFALTFASDLNRAIRRQLARSAVLRMAVVAATLVLVIAAIVTHKPAPRPVDAPRTERRTPPSANAPSPRGVREATPPA